MIVKRPLTAQQKQHLIDKTKPKQEAINEASSSLHEYELLKLNEQDKLNIAVDYLLTDLMTRVAELENKSTPAVALTSKSKRKA